MKLFWRISQQLILFLFLTQNVFAQNIPEPMSPPRLVNDFANIFSETEKQALESKLRIYNDTTSTQIYVVTVKELDGYAASDYSFRLGEKWKIGQKTKDNGAVILIKPKVGNSRGQTFIAVGYGLEARLNDAYIGRIYREMITYFDKNDYFSGVNVAIDSMIKRLSGEFDPDMQDSEEPLPTFVIIMFIVFFIVFILSISKKGGGDQNIGGDGSSRGSRGPIFFPPIMGGSRGFGGGGFGGGGFGGGGGGRFGGGGAGGSW